MAKALTAEQRKMRIEMVDFLAQWVISQAKAEYYTPEDVEYLTTQISRVAKFLCVKN
jgi:hypothetical protein